ncbi:MAG: hypothetical protein Alpg2KO_19620 [Alphaproteobacteria bacterium]
MLGATVLIVQGKIGPVMLALDPIIRQKRHINCLSVYAGPQKWMQKRMSDTRVTLNLPDEKGEGLWCVAFWLMVLGSVVLHVLQLDARPLHHDEAVNGWFLDNMITGKGWSYDPTNYHGPFLYYFHTMLAGVTGISESGLRMPVAVASALLPVLLVGFRHWMGWSGLFFCAALLTASPAMLYYGRTFIHETYLAISLALLLVVAHRYAIWRMAADWLALWAIIALIMTIKETGLISVAVMAIAAVMADAVASLLKREMPQTLNFIKRMAPPGGSSDKMLVNLALGLAIWQFLLLMYFTSFFKNMSGWLDIWYAYVAWFETGHGTGHNQPFWHYLKDVLWMQNVRGNWVMQESPIVVFAALAGLYSLYRGSRFGLFLAAWTAGTFLAYSITPYKTPWLAVQIILPMALVAGWGLGHLWVYLSIRGRELIALPLLLVAAVPIGWMGNDAARLAFVDFSDHHNPYIYAHTNKEVAGFLDMINEIGEDEELRETSLAVMASGLWPMPWYVRNWQASGFWERKRDEETQDWTGWPEKISDDMMMVSRDGQHNHEQREFQQVIDAENLIEGEWKRREVNLRPGLRTYLYVNPEAWDRLLPLLDRYGMTSGWTTRAGLWQPPNANLPVNVDLPEVMPTIAPVEEEAVLESAPDSTPSGQQDQTVEIIEEGTAPAGIQSPDNGTSTSIQDDPALTRPNQSLPDLPHFQGETTLGSDNSIGIHIPPELLEQPVQQQPVQEQPEQ